MALKFLDYDGLLYFWQKLKTTFVAQQSGKGLSTNDYTTTEKNKLSGISSGAEVNQNAFSNVKVGSTTVAADGKTDTLELEAGSNVTLTPDATNDKVTIAATDTTYDLVGANGTTGLIKNGSTVTSSSGYTASPIISGVPYYKDTTYSTMTGEEANAGTSTTGRLISASVLTQTIKNTSKMFYGTCNTASSEATKIVILTAFESDFELLTGVRIAVLFSNPIGNFQNSGVSIKIGANGTAIPLAVPSPGDSDQTNNSTTFGDYAYSSRLRWDTGANGNPRVIEIVYDGEQWRIIESRGDTIYGTASTSNAGLMSASDKTKLNKLVFDSNNLIDSSILPSYVDDVIEAYPRTGQTELSQNWLASGSASGTVITPETGKIYVLMADSTSYAANSQFRWSGSAYVKMADGGVSAITNSEIDTIVAT